MKRRILSIFCVLALCLTLLPGTALAVDDWTYYPDGNDSTISDGETTLKVSRSGQDLTITGVSVLASSGELVLPTAATSRDGTKTYTVTGIGAGAFKDCSSLTSITVPDGFTIGNAAFADCTNLKSVTLPSDLTAIPSSLFDGCTSLTDIEWPEHITSIGNYAFQNCTSLTSITVPSGVTSIGSDAFHGCSKLEHVELPESMTSIGAYAFRNCTSLTDITLPEKISEIGSATFRDCTSLTFITVPGAVTAIGYYAFYGCTNLKEVTVLATTPPTLDSAAFNGGTSNSLTAIYVPADSVEDYKGAENWSSLAGKIQPIVEESMTLTPDSASWEGAYGTDFESKTFTIANVGDDAITISSVKLGGTNADDFTLDTADMANSLDSGEKTTFTVTPKADLAVGTYNATVTVTATVNGETETKEATLTCTVNAKSLEGAQVQVASDDYTYTGEEIKPGVTVTLDGKLLTADDYTLSYENNTNAGEATVTAAGKGNYSGTAEGTFTINKAEPTVSEVEVSSPETIYDTTDISAITLTSTGTKGTVALDAGQTLTVGEGSYRWTFTPTDTTNYTTATGSITLTVAVDTVQSITVSTAPTKTTYTYGDSFDKTGMEVTATYASGETKNVTEDVTITPTELTVDVTTVTISYGGQTTTQGITVNPKEISITSATVQDKTYDGTINATVGTVTFTGLVNGEGLAINTDYTATAVFNSANAGSQTATVTVTLKEDSNYTFGSNSNTANTTATATIQQAALTVTAPSKTITGGDTIPDLSTLQATVTGLVGEDTFSGVTLAYEGTPDSNTPGTWAIKPRGGSLTIGNTNNYTVSYVNGTLTVEKKPVSGSGTSGGTTTPSGPSTGGSDGWTEIEDEVDETPPGSTVTVDMNGTTEVPAEVFEAVAGKDVTLELDMGGGVKWEINGQDIPADADLTDLDLGVTMNTSDIPMDVINLVTGEKSTVQLTLAHDGEFGFTLTLTAPVGVQNKGLWANLYHYNTTQKQMLFETAAQVDASGNVALKFTHASEYAIVLDEKSHELPFTDTAKGAWYQGAVEYVYRNSIMTGTSATTFEPNTTLSRAMVAQILYNLEGQPTVTGESTFTDVSGHWAIDAITWAQKTGVVDGYEDNTFRPENNVTRQEFAQMMYNYAAYKDYDLSAKGDLSQFTDGDSVQEWAVTAMSWANGNALINGHDDGTLEPGGTTTRAQAASILMRFDQNLVEN